MPDFLLEIGCEEIPARMIDAAALDLREQLDSLLQRERLDPPEPFPISTRRAGWPFSLPAFPHRSRISPST